MTGEREIEGGRDGGKEGRREGGRKGGREGEREQERERKEVFPFSHQVQLQTGKLGDSVDECDAMLKKHEAFERLIGSQEGKV